MGASLGCILRWFLAALLIFALLQRSGAITWTLKPQHKTMIFVEGVNNTDEDLRWNFSWGNDETILTVTFERKKESGSTVDVAHRTSSGSFSRAVPGITEIEYNREYVARPPATLRLKQVNDGEEYVYTIEVAYSDKDGNLLKARDSVTVIVYVPPTITTRPNRRPVVRPGQSVTLTCNASGDPLPKINWTREGFAGAQLNASSYKLYLNNVQRKDVGGYKCTADNGYGTATSLSVLQIDCQNRCKEVVVAIRITGGAEWDPDLERDASELFKTLEASVTSEIAAVYRTATNAPLYELEVDSFTKGSIRAIVKMKFQEGNTDALLKPLRDAISDRRLGPFTVDPQLVVDPTTPPNTSPSGQTPTPTKGDPDTGARGAGLSDGALAGIIAGCAAFLIVIIIIIIVCCIKKKKQGETSKSKYTEADGYRMNRQPPPSGLGTASPAYVEARMYAPANATKKQDDQPKPLNYADLSFDKSGKPPPRYGSGTEYSEMSPEKRPPPAGGQGGGGQGEGGFELWC